MNPNLLYAFEKFSLAVDKLAVGAGDVRSRLYEAAIIIVPVKEDDIPMKLKEDFFWIKNSLTKYPSKYEGTPLFEGSIKSTLFRIRIKTGVKIAERIVDLTSRLEGYVNSD